MAKKIVNIYDKTINKRFPDWKAFWSQAQTAFLNLLGAKAGTKDKVNAYFFAFKVYDYWKHNIYWGYEEQFYGKLYTRLATAFLELQKKENLYNQLFAKIKYTTDKLVNIKTTETTAPSKEVIKNLKKGMLVDRRWDSEGKDHGMVKAINRNKPLAAVDLIAGEYGLENKADWLQTELETVYGVRGKEGDRTKFNPNWSTGKGHFHDKANYTDDQTRTFGQGRKTLTTQEQPQHIQQIANIIRSFSLAESAISSYVIDYFSDLFYNNTIYMPPGAELKWDYQQKKMGYKSRGELEDEEQEEQKKKKIKVEFERLSLERYEELKARGEAVEDTLDLENLCRRRAEKTKYPLRDNTKQATLMQALNTLILAYTRELYWPSVAGYEKVMGQITGFREFKIELRRRTEIAEYYNSIRKKMPQVFYCLLGKPGVGKSEISKTLSKAYKRPFSVLGMAGASHEKILKGMRPTLDGARYGDIVAAFVDARANIFISKEEHQKVLDKLNAKEKKTKNQEEYIKYLQDEIKDIEEQEKKEGQLRAEREAATGRDELETAIKKQKIQDKIDKIHGKNYDLPSKGPIILLDESEKVKDKTVLFIMGQITDRELNYWYTDNFLEYGINLGEAIILLTANYAELVPDFVRSRCKFVNINLLSFRERLNILQIRRDMLIREYFPAPRYDWESLEAAVSEIDKYNARRSKIAPLTEHSDYNDSEIYLTDLQQRIKNLISDEILKLSITETFGIREGIMNLVSIFDFLVLAMARHELNNLPGSLFLKKGTNEGETGSKREDFPNKDGSGIINLYYNAMRDTSHNREPLTIILKRDTEFKKDKKQEEGKAESVLNMVSDFPGYSKDWKPEV